MARFPFCSPNLVDVTKVTTSTDLHEHVKHMYEPKQQAPYLTDIFFIPLSLPIHPLNQSPQTCQL